MGQLAAEEMLKADGFHLVGLVERPDHPELGKQFFDLPLLADEAALPEANVWLDFSLAAPAVTHAERAAEARVPVLIAATGFSEADIARIRRASERCPILISANLSTGVAALEELASETAKLLSDNFTSAIVETHHSAKKDAPSGTAKRLAERMRESGASPTIMSIRGGGVIGEHEIRFLGPDEEVILIHRAFSRRAFTGGITKALKFIAGQPAGLYAMQDVYRSVA